MKRSTKIAILEKLYLRNHRLLFLLYCNRWLRLAFGICIAILIGIPASTTRFILATPSSSNPEIRVSVVDILQGLALARTARSATEKKDTDLALESWRRAIGNHPGRIDYNQDYLKSLVLLDDGRTRWKDALKTVQWLLHITQTNQSSLEISAEALDHYRLDQTLVDLVKNRQDSVVSGGGEYLKALFRLGQYEEFKEQWNALPTNRTNDSNLTLYQAAYNAMNSPHRKESRAYRCLENALRDKNSRQLTRKLLLHVSNQWEDHEQFSIHFKQLRMQFADDLTDHLLHWDLLLREGNRSQARREAQEYVNPPMTGNQVVRLADGYVKLGMPEAAHYCLQNYAIEHGFLHQKQYAHAMLLISQQRWPDLGRFAISIRQQEESSSSILAFSYYIGGLAAHQQRRYHDATREFRSITHYSLSGSSLSLYVGANLWRLDYPRIAYAILSEERVHYADHPSYWKLFFDVTTALQLPAPMLQAASNLYRLAPHEVEHQLNYASLLISQRQQLDRALALTFEVLTRYPNSISARVNYAQALALSNRLDEAAINLGRIDPTDLNSSERQGYLFAQMIIQAQNNQFSRAYKTAQGIIPELLLPGDRAYFRSIMASFNKQIAKSVTNPAAVNAVLMPPNQSKLSAQSAIQ